MSISVGDRAPDFRLQATGGRELGLSDFLGKPLVLVFDRDDMPARTKQLNSYNDDLAQFEALNAQVVAISAESVESHEKFAIKHGFKFPLLADQDKAVAGAYGTLGPLGFPPAACSSSTAMGWFATRTAPLPASPSARWASWWTCCSACPAEHAAHARVVSARVRELAGQQEHQGLGQHRWFLGAGP